MHKNIGTPDRLARLVIGLVLIAAGSFLGIAINFILGSIIILAGLFCVYEAVVGWCALYSLLGKNTCPVKGPP